MSGRKLEWCLATVVGLIRVNFGSFWQHLRHSRVITALPPSNGRTEQLAGVVFNYTHLVYRGRGHLSRVVFSLLPLVHAEQQNGAVFGRHCLACWG